MVKKKFEDIFIRVDVIHERDRQTDGHRVTAEDRTYAYASRGKNSKLSRPTLHKYGG